jgi:ubiquitin C-terminal hydrolase
MSKKNTLALEYKKFVTHIWSKTQEPFEPYSIKKYVSHVAPRFAGYDQQDAQEFMTFLLTQLHEDLQNIYVKSKQKTTIISELFHGQIDAITTCLTCKKEQRTPNVITFIPVPLFKTKRSFTIHYLHHSSDTFNVEVSAAGKVGDLVLAFCNALKSNHYLSVGGLFERIQVWSNGNPKQEFTFDTPLNNILETELNFTRCKNVRNYPPQPIKDSILDLYDCLREFFILQFLDGEWYCNTYCHKPTYAAKKMNLTIPPRVLIIQLKRFDGEYAYGQKLNMLVNYPLEGLDLSSLVANDEGNKTFDPLLYDLIAISNHTGTMTGGHYTTTARKLGTNEWYNFNDSSVSRENSNNIVTASAYLLIYVKREYEENYF